MKAGRRVTARARPDDVAGAVGVPCEVRALWAPKAGNTDDEWEDAFAVDEARGRVSVADGASQGIFCRLWAGILTAGVVEAGPDLSDPARAADWLRAWRKP